MSSQASGFCTHCQKRVLTISSGVNHGLHLILTILTMGAWGFVWAILAAINVAGGSYKCSQCGTKV